MEVVREGKYHSNEWVVKADPDTVWFPERLIQVLQLGLPAGLVKRPPPPPAGRRLGRGHGGEKGRGLQDGTSWMGGPDGCSMCRLPGHEGESCSQHAVWLQENKQLTCEEALT